MTFRSGGQAAVLAVTMAIATFIPGAVARADILDGVTVAVDETTDTAEGTTGGSVDTSVVGDTVDTTETQLDGAIGDTGTPLDEPVNDLTDRADETTEDITGTVGLPDESGSTTTTTTTTIASASESHPGTEVVDRAAEAEDEGDDSVVGSGVGNSTRPDRGQVDADGLTVLSAAGGLSDLDVLEEVSVAAISDDSLYGRLLSWIAGAGTGILGILVGPLLALEILLRALLSAGSGLVAPASLLASYLFRLVWESRVSTPAVTS